MTDTTVNRSGSARARPMTAEERKVIVASSAGTIFEWYDFYLYGSLAAIIGAQFFTAFPEATRNVFALLAFAAGFIVGVLAAAGGGYWYYTKKQEEAAAAEAARVAQVAQTLKTTAFQPSTPAPGTLKKATGRGALASGTKRMPTISDLKATTA